MRLSCYVAAPWVCRQDAQILAAAIDRRYGWRIAHPWWEFEAADDDHARLQTCARLDMHAVLGCDVFVLLNSEKSEGKAVETGLALAVRSLRCSGPTLIGIGPRYTNIFQHLAPWQWFDTVDEFLFHAPVADSVATPIANTSGTL